MLCGDEWPSKESQAYNSAKLQILQENINTITINYAVEVEGI